MEIRRLHIQNFRGFDDMSICPNGHVVIMGEPGAGRSDVIESLKRVLDANALRTRTTSELDFHRENTSKPIQISVTLGSLGPLLEQDFLDKLELWDSETRQIVPESDGAGTADDDQYEWVLRLEYRGVWQPNEQRCEEWIFFVKDADPASDVYQRTRWTEIEKLGVTFLRRGDSNVLGLAPRSRFRRVLETSVGDDFPSSVRDYLNDVTLAAEKFSNSEQVKDALERVVEPIGPVLGVEPVDVAKLFRFSPDDGSVSGLLRSLGPDVDLGDTAGSLPLWRQGSTTSSLIRLAEGLAMAPRQESVIAVDDLGDRMDSAAATHIATTMLRTTGQVWVTTRMPAVAEVFEPHEMVRLGRGSNGARIVRQGRRPQNKVDISTSKFWHRSLVPAMSYRSVIILEGSDDFAALHNLTIRMSIETGTSSPASSRVAMVSAGSVGGGGYAMAIRLAKVARGLGLRAVAGVDGDTDDASRTFIEGNQNLANAIVRLPDGVAIERAIVDKVPADVLIETLTEVAIATGLQPPQNIGQLEDARIRTEAMKFIKQNSLHGLFVNALPSGNLPQLAVSYVDTLVDVATGDQSGVMQL